MVWRKEDFLKAWALNTSGGTAKGTWGKFFEAMSEAHAKDTKGTQAPLTAGILCARMERTRSLLAMEGIKCPDTPERPKTMNKTTADIAKELGFGTKMSAAERKKFNSSLDKAYKELIG